MFFRRTKPACRTVDCPGDDSPIRNYTAEGPDQRLFCRLGTFTDTPKIGECWERTGCAEVACSPVSTAQAQLEATQAAAECVWSTWSTPSCPPGPNGIPPTQPPPVEPTREPVNIYRNDAQTCTVYCDDGTPVSYTVPAGRYSKLSKLEANTAAYTEACVEAQKLLNEGECMGCCDQVEEILNILRGTGTGPPVFTGPNPGSGTESEGYAGQIRATGQFPMSFTVIAGSLPTGLSMSSSGTISGTATVGGTYSFTVQAANSLGTTTQDFEIVIQGVAPLFATNMAFAYGAINNPVFTPDGVTTQPYSAFGPYGLRYPAGYSGTPPITWSVSAGALPDGLTVDPATGFLVGFPNNPAQVPSGFVNFNYTLRGTNDWGTYAVSIDLQIFEAGWPIP